MDPVEPADAPPPVADRLEVLELLSWQARKGHVPAMRLLLAELRMDGVTEEQAPSVIDELAARREATTG